MTRGWSTNCAWCYAEAGGRFYCSRCELLTCEYCGWVYGSTESWACEWCSAGCVAPEWEVVSA